jgi:hypothetical protein
MEYISDNLQTLMKVTGEFKENVYKFTFFLICVRLRILYNF